MFIDIDTSEQLIEEMRVKGTSGYDFMDDSEEEEKGEAAADEEFITSRHNGPKLPRGTNFFDPEKMLTGTIIGADRFGAKVDNKFASNVFYDDFKVKVLSTSKWAMQNYYMCRLPQELRQKQDTFEQFYLRKNPSRTI